MARVSVSMYDEGWLPVDIQGERFSFGEVIYLTVGGLASSDMVCIHLSRDQLAAVGEAIAAYQCEGDGSGA